MKTILIIDDSRETAEVLSLILEMNGYRAAWAPNGIEGLERVAEIAPDLIILDYMMPLMNGADMCQVLGENSVTSGIKILVHTCLAESAVNARFNRYDAFLRKHYEIDLALQLIQGLLESS